MFAHDYPDEKEENDNKNREKLKTDALPDPPRPDIHCFSQENDTDHLTQKEKDQPN